MGTFMTKHCSPESYGTPLEKKSCSAANYGSPLDNIDPKLAKKMGIKTVSLTGFQGGKLRKITDYQIHTPIFDQQPAEDINQIILHILVLRLLICMTKLKIKQKEKLFEKVKRKYLGDIAKNLSLVKPDFMSRLLGEITERYLDGKKIFLYAPEGGSASISANHVTHNLQWDAISEVKNPPTVHVSGSLLPQQYSGVANDRRGFYVHGTQIRIAGEKGDLLILFAKSLESKPVKHAILEALEKKMGIYVFTTKHKKIRFKKINVLELDSADDMVFGDISQIIGHILGRLIRTNLLAKL